MIKNNEPRGTNHGKVDSSLGTITARLQVLDQVPLEVVVNFTVILFKSSLEKWYANRDVTPGLEDRTAEKWFRS